MPFFDDPEIVQTLLDKLSIGIYFVDREWKISYWNSGAEKISGFTWRDVLGHKYRNKLLVQYDESGAVVPASQLYEAMMNGASREADVLLLHKDGYRVPVHVCAVPLRDSSGKFVGAAEMFEEQRLPVLGGRRSLRADTPFLVDKRTGLPERESTRARIQRALTELEEHQVPFCLMFMAIDGFAQFQAAHGIVAAENAEKVVAHTVTSALRPDDFVGCWESNLFVAVLRYCEKPGLERVGERIRSMVNCSQVEWWGEELVITVSIGGAAATTEDNVESLMQRAQQGLQQSLKDGGNRLTLTSADLKASGA